MPLLDMSPAFADAEAAVQGWLKKQPQVTALTGQRIFLGLPRKGPSAYPCLSIFRLGGGPEEGDYPIDRVHLQIDCWGNAGDKLRTWSVAKAVVSSLLSMQCGTLLSETVRGMGVHGITVPYLPDPGTGQARYVVDSLLQCQAV